MNDDDENSESDRLNSKEENTINTRIFTPSLDSNPRRNSEETVPIDLYSASGLKSTFHGVVYQLKLLMLYAWIGKNNGFKFRLATEMDAAEKFDDIVFFFQKDTETSPRCKLIQAKHIQDKNKKITSKDLLYKLDDKFSLYKYLQSHSKIKQNDKFRNINCDYIICTNIGFQFDNTYISSGNISKLQDQELYLEADFNNDDEIFNKDGEQYRFVRKESNHHESVVNTLKTWFSKYSDIKQLSNELVQCIVEQKPIPLDKEPFLTFSIFLQQQVLNIQHSTVFQDFIIKGPDDCVLRKAFQEALLEYKEKVELKKLPANYSEELLNYCLNDADTCSAPKRQKGNIRKSVIQKYDIPIKIKDGILLIPYRDPCISNVENCANDFAKKFCGKHKNQTIYIRTGKGDNKLYKELNELRGHVFVEENNRIKLSSRFLSNSSLPGNLNDLRRLLFQKLKIPESTLSKYNFQISNYKTYQENDAEHLIDSPPLPIRNSLATEYIEDFLNDVIFCVNQPNADRLDSLISEQIAKEFNLVNTDLISHEFMNSIINWMKEKQGPANRFISEDSDIFVEVAKKIAQLVIVGPTCEMVRKISKLQLRFQKNAILADLYNFMEQKIPSLLCIFMPRRLTHLGSVAVLQELSDSELNLKPGSYIFLRLMTWLHLVHEIKYALEKKDINLVIIEFKTTKNMPKYDQILYRLKKMLQHRKKFIFIMDDAYAQDLHNIHINYTSKDFIPEFAEFDECTKSHLLNTNVNFQGNMCPLNKIIGGSGSLVDLEMIKKLANKEIIRIGHVLWNFSGYDKDWYVGRKFTRQILIDPVVLKGENIQDVFAIIDKKDEHLEMFDQVVVHNFHLKNTFHCKIIVIENLKQFGELCKENNTKHNVHLLKCASGVFIWMRSQGSVTKLMPFIVNEKSFGMLESLPENQSEEEFSVSEGEVDNNLLLVSSEAGMGKSTVLSSISQIIRKIMEPNVWIIRLDLNDYTKVLLEEQNSHQLNCVDDSISFVVDKLLAFKTELQLKTSFEREIFKHYLKYTGKMIFMIDGVDEISPNYEHLIITLINLLRQSNAHKIFVTTRPHIKKNLEEKLGVFSYKIVPFSFENQQEFLRKFLCKQLEIDLLDPANKYFFECINDVIKKLHSSISDRERSFMGIPLQMRMIAKIFLSQIDRKDMEISCQIFVECFHTDLIKLYNEFIRIILNEIYWTEKKGIDFSKTGTPELMDLNYKIFFKHYQELAVYSLFTEEERYQLNFLENFETIKYNSQIGIRNVGLIEYVGDKPQFIHRSFAEYFVATYLSNKILFLRDNDDIDIIITQIFCKSQYQVVRAFLNNLMIKEKSLTNLVAPIILKKMYAIWINRKMDLIDNLGNTIFHTAAIEGNIAIIEFLTSHGSITDNDGIYNLINAKNNRGRTILHSAVSKGYLDIIQFICALYKSDDNMLIDFHAVDKHMKTAFFTAVVRDDWKTAKWFLENVPETKKDINSPNSASNHYIAHIAVKQGHQHIIQFLQQCEIDLYLVDSNQKTLLHSAITSNQHNMTEWIIGNEALAQNMINHRDKDDMTPLMLAVLLGQRNTVELLFSKQEVDINDPVDKNQITLMHLAAKCNNVEFVAWFLKTKKPDLTKLDTSKHTPLHKTASCGKLDVFKMLFKEYMTVSNSMAHVVIKSLAHIAAIGNKSDIFQWLLEQCLDQFHKTNILESILHAVAGSNQPDQLSWILSQGININAADEHGRTPLHLIVRNGKKSEIKSLIDYGADLNALDNEKRSPLHYVIESGRIETMQLLIDEGADMGIVDTNGVTVFHLAAKSGQPKKIQLLCKYPQYSSFLILLDNNENNVLHYVSRQKRLDQYIWMLQYIKHDIDINARNIFGRTILHNACFKGSMIIVKYLLGEIVMYHKEEVKIQRPTDANITCKQNQTILHSAAISGNDQLVQWLIEKRGLPILDSTEILLAAKYDRLKTVKYLSSIVDMNVIDTSGRNILHMACLCRQNVNVLKWLLETQDALNINTKDNKGRSPLLVAASFRNWDAVKVLLNHKGIDVNTFDNRQWSLLHVVTKCGKFQILQDLLENYHARDDTVDKDGRTILLSAARSGSLEIFKYLKNERHLKVTTDNDNCTLLHAAARSGNVQLCELLITEKLCNPRSTDNNNRTALHFACRPGHLDLVKYLVKNNADASIIDKNNVSILHEAAYSGNVLLLEWLVRDQNMSIHIVDNDGRSIMHSAVRFGHVNIIDWLITQGADINVNTNIPATAGTILHEACRYGQWYTAKCIIQRCDLLTVLDSKSRTPIDIAIENKQTAIEDLLRSAIVKNATTYDEQKLAITSKTM